MGFGLLFKIDESSLSRHENDRKVKFEEADSPALPDNVTHGIDQENDQYYITGQVYKRKKFYTKVIEDFSYCGV